MTCHFADDQRPIIAYCNTVNQKNRQGKHDYRNNIKLSDGLHGFERSSTVAHGYGGVFKRIFFESVEKTIPEH